MTGSRWRSIARRRHGNVVGKRRGRVLDDGHVVTGVAEDAVDIGLPAGAVDEAAVDEDDAHGISLSGGPRWPELARIVHSSVRARIPAPA